MFSQTKTGACLGLQLILFCCEQELCTASPFFTTASTNIRNDEGKTKGCFLSNKLVLRAKEV